MQDCQLPAKKFFGTSKHEFIDNMREQFEQYLQVSYGLVPSEKSIGTSNLSLKVQLNLDMSNSVDSNIGKVKIFLTSCFKLNLLLFSQNLIYRNFRFLKVTLQSLIYTNPFKLCLFIYVKIIN
jgi:hypothetical protein